MRLTVIEWLSLAGVPRVKDSISEFHFQCFANMTFVVWGDEVDGNSACDGSPHQA